MQLSLPVPKFYRVKKGQTLTAVAKTFRLPPRLLASANRLSEEIREGQVLVLPAGGDLYTVRGGESKALLCGSEEAFRTRNGTDVFYIGQTVLL